MKKISYLALAIAFFYAPISRADLFGGDVAVLSQILANEIQQLAQLEQIMGTGRDSLDLMREINQGINDSLMLAKTINPKIDPGIYKNWASVQDALNQLQLIYGVAAPSVDQKVFQDTDQSVAEAVTMNNSIYDYANQIDSIGEEIKAASHTVSPGGAQKLTAESLGVMLHVLNTSLRAQATGLKLQAQSMAIQNKHEKDSSNAYLTSAATIGDAMTNETTNFSSPRF